LGWLYTVYHNSLSVCWSGIHAHPKPPYQYIWPVFKSPVGVCIRTLDCNVSARYAGDVFTRGWTWLWGKLIGFPGYRSL